MREVDNIINDYRNKVREFANTDKADERFSQYLPRVREALLKAENIIRQYESMQGQIEELQIYGRSRDDRWRDMGRGNDYQIRRVHWHTHRHRLGDSRIWPWNW